MNENPKSEHSKTDAAFKVVGTVAGVVAVIGIGYVLLMGVYLLQGYIHARTHPVTDESIYLSQFFSPPFKELTDFQLVRKPVAENFTALAFTFRALRGAERARAFGKRETIPFNGKAANFLARTFPNKSSLFEDKTETVWTKDVAIDGGVNRVMAMHPGTSTYFIIQMLDFRSFFKIQ